MAKNIQRYLAIADEDMYYLTGRAYRNKYCDFSKNHLDLTDLADRMTSQRRQNKGVFRSPMVGHALLKLKPLRFFYTLICKIVLLFRCKPLVGVVYSQLTAWLGEAQYTAYIPHNMPFCMVVSLHPHCQQMVFVEEGALVFVGRAAISRYRQWIVNYLIGFLSSDKPVGKRVWLNIVTVLTVLGMSAYSRDYIPKWHVDYGENGQCFAFSKQAFALTSLEQRVIPFAASDFTTSNQTLKSLPDGACVLILDSWLTWYHISLESIVESLQSMPAYFQNAKTIYLKTHPSGKMEEQSAVLKYLAGRFTQIHTIDDDEPLEAIFQVSKKLHILGFHSSLLFYAPLLNSSHTVYSLEAVLHKKLQATSTDYPSYLLALIEQHGQHIHLLN